jgi:cytochrome c peroxidase
MHCAKAVSVYRILISRVCVSFLALGLLSSTVASDTSVPVVPTVTIRPLGLPSFPKIDDDPTLVAYGAFLFQSKLLSSDQTLACTSCHVPEFGFSGARPTAVGVGGQQGSRHVPPLINLTLGRRFMLDGRAASLVDQIPLPIESTTEMNADWPSVLARLADRAETSGVLRAGRTLDKTMVVKSLAAYVGTLVSGDSPFDRFYYGGEQQAISGEAKEGLLLFVRKGRCSGCHLITGYAAPLTDGSFHAIGVGFENGAYRDLGRGAVTGKVSDRGAFKTPTLRNVALRPYLMHDGSMTSLREVIDYYNKGGNRSAPNLDGRIRPLFLSESEVEAIIAFLETLTAPVQSYQKRGEGG